MSQLSLFPEPEPEPEPEVYREDRRCGTCASMDETLAGCWPGHTGRCVDPAGRAYYLLPENTRINTHLPPGDPDREPEGGSWAYVARDSCGCDAHRERRR